MPRFPAARRYARALFDLALEQNALDVVQADLTAIATRATRKGEYQALLTRHTLKAEDRKRLWDLVLKDQAHPLTRRFVHFLVDKRRGEYLGDIIAAFFILFDESRNIAPLRVTSAHPLTPAQQEALTSRFARKLGKQIRLILEVDPALLGGFRAQADDIVYDYSVSGQLEQLHHNMASA